MPLILCKECKEKISTEAEQCIYCGCPIVKNKNPLICKINNVEYDFTDFYERIITIKRNNGLWTDPDIEVLTKEMRKLTNIAATFKLCQVIAETEEVPSEYNDNRTMNTIKQKQQQQSQQNIPKCPKCGSTAITPGQRGYSFWTGFLEVVKL